MVWRDCVQQRPCPPLNTDPASLWAPVESGDTWKSSPMWPRFSSHCNLPVHLFYLIMRCTESKGRNDSPKSTGDRDFQDSLLLLKCDPSVLVPWRHLIRIQQYRPPQLFLPLSRILKNDVIQFIVEEADNQRFGKASTTLHNCPLMKVVPTMLESCDMKVETHKQKDSSLYPHMLLLWQMFNVFKYSNVQFQTVGPKNGTPWSNEQAESQMLSPTNGNPQNTSSWRLSWFYWQYQLRLEPSYSYRKSIATPAPGPRMQVLTAYLRYLKWNGDSVLFKSILAQFTSQRTWGDGCVQAWCLSHLFLSQGWGLP